MTAALEGVDPLATYAILVGIEKYENDAYLPTLHDSPAADALAHAGWLRANGVPAEQIRLCLSVEEARQESVEAEAAALGIEVRGATQADIWAVLANELPTWKGDLLWLAWSGHGSLDPGAGEQYLFYADAIRFREYTLSTENLQDTLLHNPLYTGIPRTVLLVDACRQYLPGFTGAGGFRFPAPTQHNAGSRLMSLYATQDGATASNGRTGAGGAFTTALLAELTAATAWPPDPQTLIDPVRARLTADRTRQTPYLDARHWDGDRRGWGRTTPRHAAVLTHDQALHRIGRKGRYLSDDHLPYVAPEDPRHPAAPANLLDRLADPPTTEFGDPVRGVLLTAPWGAGKTRTCLETAKLAREQGWHVLHIAQPEGRDGATRLLVDDLLAEIREDTEEDPERRFLLVFDYLDSQRYLDLRALADALGAEDPDGSRIACLASVRPGALDLVHQRGSQELFEETPLATDDLDQRAVAASIFERVAPRALEAWGPTRMARACGTRPVLALLHALAVEKNLERLLADGDTAPGDQRLEPTAARSETLLHWLNRRTGEGLTVPGDPKEERALLLAVTVAALACTQPRDAVENAVDRCLTRTGTAFDDGQSVVNRLVALGWLLPTTDLPDSVELMHDIVAEAFLQQTCLPRAVALHAASLNQLLETFLGDLPSFRRAVEHIGRWAKELEPDRQRELVRACTTWTADRAPALVDMLVTDPHDGMRALTAMVSDTPWRHGVTEAWDTVVLPWMDRAGDPALVRTFLTDAVRNTLRPPENLLDCARTWLDAHITTAPDSLALINVLARVPDLPDSHRADLDRLTLTWLREHGDTPEARDRLVALLQHDGHSPTVQAAAQRTAIALAHRLRDDLPTGELLTVLTHTTTADDEGWPVLTESLHDWLRHHTTRERAVSLYVVALRHAGLPSSKAEHLAKLGVRWLGGHARKSVAGRLLTVLLDRSDIPARQVGDATLHAHTWLQHHGTRRGASFVLARLLNQARTGIPVAPGHTVAHTLSWLDRYATDTAADYVLRLALRIPATATAELTAEAAADRTFEHALTWIDRHSAHSTDTQVLVYLLSRTPDLTERQLERVTAAALRRLQRPHPPEPSDRHLFKQLLKREPQSPETEELLHTSALAWLDLHGDSPEAAYVLPSLTGRARYLERPDDLAVAVDRALDWLDLHHTIPTAGRVLRILLMCQGVTTATRDAATVTQQSFEHTLAWYDALPVPEDDPGALANLLQPLHSIAPRGGELSPEQAERAARHVIACFRGQHRGPDTGEWRYALDGALKYPPLEPDTETALVRTAKKWLGHRHDQLVLADTFTLTPLLGRLREAPEPDGAILRVSLGWLKRFGRSPEATFLLHHLLNTTALPRETLDTALGHAVIWLRAHGTLPGASYVIAPVLTHLRERGGSDRGAVDHAMEWLRANPRTEDNPQHDESTWRVLSSVAGHPAAAPHHPELRERARDWIATGSGTGKRNAVLAELLGLRTTHDGNGGTDDEGAPGATPEDAPDTTSCTPTEPAPAPR